MLIVAWRLNLPDASGYRGGTLAVGVPVQRSRGNDRHNSVSPPARPNQSDASGSTNGYVAREKEVAAAAIETNQPHAYQLTVDEVLTALGADAQNGLSRGDAQAR